MGNKLNTNVTSGVKDQAAGEVKFKLYKFIDLKGGGELVDMMKRANRTKNYKDLDERIQEGLREFLYNEGEGKIVHFSEAVERRCKDRGIVLNKKPTLGLDVNEMEAMTEDETYLKKHGMSISQ